VRRSNELGAKGSNRSAVVFGIAMGLIAILAHSVVDFNMHVPANAMTAIALISILTCHLRFATEGYWFNPGVVGKIFSTLLLAGIFGYFTVQIARIARETYYNRKSEKPLLFAERLEILKKAYSIEPNDPDLIRSIGEILRKKGWEGEDGFEAKLQEALVWFEKGMRLNRWDPYNYAYSGMCYTWLGEKQKASEMFEKSKELDPENYYLLSLYGWHLFQEGKLVEARGYFGKSLGYFGWSDGKNELARSYIDLIDRKLAEQRQEDVESKK